MIHSTFFLLIYTVSPEGLVHVMPQNVTADPGCSVVFTCMTTGGPGNTFQWSHNGFMLQGENNSMLMLSDVSAETGGYYRCEVTNEAGNGSDFGIAFSKCYVLYVEALDKC